MSSNRYIESIAILNDLYITSNDNDTKYWDIVTNLASCHYHRKEYDRARLLYMKALDHKKSLGDNSEDNLSSIASILNSLGHVYYDQVQIDAAKGYYEEAYKIVKKLLGNDHIFVINIMISVANCFMTNCDYDSAHKIFYRIVGKRKDNTSPLRSTRSISNDIIIRSSSSSSNDTIDSELIISIVKLHKIYINQYKNDSSRYKMLIEQVLDMLKILLNDDDSNSILIQAKKEYRVVSNGESSSILKRLSLPLTGTTTTTTTEEKPKTTNDKKGTRKSMFDNIQLPFRTP